MSAGSYSYSAVLMGSPILLKLFEHDEALAGRVFRLIRHQENLFTVNRAQSEVMAINHAAGLHPVVVSPAVYPLIKRASEVSKLKDSCFNFAIGPLVKRWKIGFQGDTVPPAGELQALLALTDPHQVILDDDARSVFLQQAGMEIDLGAIAKGYIADVVRDYLQQQQVECALINLGGNVQTLGHPHQQSWGIGLQKPFAGPEELIGVINVTHKSVVTSGVYERYFERDGRRYHHILDPRTGAPLDNELLSVTIISDDSIDGDIWTTLLYGLGVEKSLACLRDTPQIEAIFVTRDREVICSSQRGYRFTLLDHSYRLTGSTA
ncbi:FAD:protein FMN transferase [Erwinia sorbitola]|uniref:FAD:protein FMN transferase n=1 Tax=Erwinia sorbitola TaxID=2681984 RepID=A0ABW9R7V5_9GAMM|nr:FAD:protein FMN transferase [Erwinia sorbitola]MTD26208.1 FAD:protein FMN transferase [Erwinia sorbitola]